MDHDPLEIVVVGAGAFGAASALELAMRGHVVTILDRSSDPHPDASSTDISKMIRMDYGSDVFYHELAEASLDVWDRWNEEWPRALFHPEGFLVLAASTMEPGGFEYESLRVLRKRGYEPHHFDAAQLRSRWPAWNADRYPEGYVSPRGGWAESGAVVGRLLQLGRAAGVRHVLGAFVGLTDRGSRVAGVRYTASDGSTTVLDADRVVVATGAWTPTLLPWLGDVLTPVAQPVVHYGVDPVERWQYPAFPPFAADTSGSGWYGFPALADGRLKLGHHADGRVVDPNDRGQVSDDHLELARAFLGASLPALRDAPVVGTRVCLYCDSFDDDLWIDEDPDRTGLIVAAGGSGHGFKFTPMIGRLVADVVEGRENRWLHRFTWRALGAARREAARLQH